MVASHDWTRACSAAHGVRVQYVLLAYCFEPSAVAVVNSVTAIPYCCRWIVTLTPGAIEDGKVLLTQGGQEGLKEAQGSKRQGKRILTTHATGTSRTHKEKVVK